MMWEKVSLSNVVEVIAGQSPESKYYNNKGNGIPFFQGKADFGLDYPTVRYWCTQPTKIAKPLDILFSVRAPVGPTNICDIEACIGRGLASIRVGKKLDYKFLYFYLKSIEKQIASQGNGSTFSAITTSVLKELQIPLPPLPIQKRIAEILDTADALRRKDEALLKKYDELAQAIFIDMFGDPVKNEKGWEVKKLGDILRVDAQTVNPLSLKSYNYVGLEHIEKETGKILEIDKGEVLSNKFLFTDEHILYGKLRPYLNKVAVPNFNGICSTDIFPLKPIDKIYKAFLVAILKRPDFVNHANTNAVGANLPRANKEIILKYSTIVPDIISVESFSLKVMLIEDLKEQIEKNIKSSENLFNSLLQKAFNGELIV